jgi:hypothetical protein
VGDAAELLSQKVRQIFVVSCKFSTGGLASREPTSENRQVKK